MRWIAVTVFLSNCALLQVAGQCDSSIICPDSCHCSGTSSCPDSETRRCGTNGECAQPWSGPTCRRRNLILRRLWKYDAEWDKSSLKEHISLYFALNMFDGNLRTYWLSDLQQNPWIRLKVPTYPQPVHSMRIYIDEGEQFSSRIQGFRIEVSNMTSLGTGDDCYTDKYPSPRRIYDINCSSPMVGQYVFITRPGFVQLNVHEFEIYGCEDYWFGYECDQKCNCANPSEVCDKISGSCDVSGCHLGYTGTDCTDCEDHRFGHQCDRMCNCANSTDVCDKISGSCDVSGCAPGYTGIDCYRGCEDYWFGYECDQKCNCANPSEVCDKISGSCDVSGCHPGYTGTDCTDCEDHRFGHQCDRMCNCANSTDVCDKISGSCDVSGCAPGYTGIDCYTDCEDHRFGHQCDRMCNCANSTDVCDKIIGSCNVGGCAPGYTGIDCYTGCSDRFFGYDCNSTCRCFDHNEACHKATGSCKNGCAAGYTGIDCQQECSSGQFGKGCQFFCHCSNGSRCDNVNGTCPGDCSDGYVGVACQTLAHTAVPEKVAVVGSIVGGIVGLFVLVVLVIAVIIILRRRRPKGSDTPDGTAMGEELGEQCLDPEDGLDNGVADFADDGVAYVNAQSLPTPSTTVSLRDLAAYVARRLQERKPFENEFLNLPQGLLKPCEEAQRQANVMKCRYKGMLPYDHTRVVLGVINNDPYTDFINANYINGYSQKKAYVASQGTTSQNMEEFWRMVWTIHADKIVMLSGLVESGKIKVERYWPDEHTKKTYGDIVVETMDIQNLHDCCVRTFKVQRAVKVRTVKQFQYLAWPDHDVPSDTSGILNLRDRVKFANDTHDGPVIVHCSAGVGRTGTYIGFDHLMDKLERENEVDIFQCVSDLRHQRTQMVQTPEQYAFLHMLVSDGVLCRDSKFTTDDFLSLDINSDVFQERIHDQYERMQKLVHLPMRNGTTSTLGYPGQDEDLDQEYVPRTANRVWLSTIANGKNDSINAVYVPVTKDGHELIATQSPTTDNVADFWRMIYERKCTTIALLGMEPSGSAVYWPSDSIPIRHGPFEISLLETEESGYFVRRKLSCVHLNKKNDSPQVVRHIFLIALDDDLYIPSGESILQTKESIEDWHRQIEPGHVVVQCRNGSDKTGLMCVALEILERIQTEHWVNMMVAVKRVRTACPKAVISLEQYRFCYNLVKTYLDRFSTYANFS